MNLFKLIRGLINKASRDTSTGQFIAEIDGLRFIAILTVFLFHLSEFVTGKTGTKLDGDLLASLLSHGDIGVPLFFIISGFVIALPYAKGHLFGSKIPQLKKFFIRRLSRLEPPYFINLIVLFLLLPLVTSNKALDLVPNLFASMTYVHNIVFSKTSSINVVAWSLEVELQFYILAPFLTCVFKINHLYIRRGIVIGLIVVFSVINVMLGADIPPRYGLSLLSQAQYFFTGFLLLDVYLNEWQQNPNKNSVWDVISVVAWISIVVILYMGTTAKVLIVIPMFIAYCAAFKGTLSNRFFCQPPIYTIGGMCYTIYLYHYAIISAFGRVIIKSGAINHMPIWTGIIISSIVLAPITLLLCTLFFILIEKPCMKRDWYLYMFNRSYVEAVSTNKVRE
ncbi:MAG: acyltransferase [Chlorobium sp.]|nr:acyltransferase [Chlorobium sp.]